MNLVFDDGNNVVAKRSDGGGGRGGEGGGEGCLVRRAFATYLDSCGRRWQSPRERDIEKKRIERRADRMR